MNNSHVDRTVECVKNIFDNNRCPLCDKPEGIRMRHPCGHGACDDCLISAKDCLVCLTPPEVFMPAVPDDVSTNRAKNASSLLKACEDLFTTNVYKRQRLSEQLKIEKELFPHCIQAPAKYENKRKSLVKLSKNKENSRFSFLSGENISPIKDNRMENSVKHVQKWLNSHEKNLLRKPFADLNQSYIKNQKVMNISNLKHVDIKRYERNEYSLKENKSRKRSHFKMSTRNISPEGGITKSITSSNSYYKRPKKEVDPFENNYGEFQKNEKDESGIVIDDELIVIDDSQGTVIDKDREALLAVLEANKYEDLEPTSTRLVSSGTDNCTNLTSKTISNCFEGSNNVVTKVPFYKKSPLLETCKHCVNETILINKSKDVKITVENNSFTVTIKVINSDNKHQVDKRTLPVQTTISEIIQINHDLYKEDTSIADNNNDPCKENDMVVKNQILEVDIQSQDLFADEGKQIPQSATERSCLIIQESDSDTDIENSGPLLVTADIHRSCDQLDYGVLAVVENLDEHGVKSRRAPRGHTPTSTDSSEKENFNPNRQKRNKLGKKKLKKTSLRLF